MLGVQSSDVLAFWPCGLTFTRDDGRQIKKRMNLSWHSETQERPGEIVVGGLCRGFPDRWGFFDFIVFVLRQLGWLESGGL